MVSETDINAMFSEVCDERKAAYREAAKNMALQGMFDDCRFLLNLIGDETGVDELIGLKVWRCEA